ncbi:MAG TPA: 2OG-Fe(II) oxygenase [Allosphingosinicella sp.]|nr:2OG-Fe(II) oxygenase [Allosphingosinicella sp.]
MTPLLPPFRIEDDLLDADERGALLQWALANEQRFVPAALGGERVDPSVRLASSLRDLGPLDAIFRERMRDRAAGLVEMLRVSPFALSEIELELVAHNDGAHFQRHEDTYSGTAHSRRGERMLSGVYYFHREPKRFSGGALRLYPFGAAGEDNGVDIEPEQGRLVVFPSWAAHEVRTVCVPTRAFADSRFAVNCWLYRASTRISGAASS